MHDFINDLEELGENGENEEQKRAVIDGEGYKDFHSLFNTWCNSRSNSCGTNKEAKRRIIPVSWNYTSKL